LKDSIEIDIKEMCRKAPSLPKC